jgi:hypothetical protein
VERGVLQIKDLQVLIWIIRKIVSYKKKDVWPKTGLYLKKNTKRDAKGWLGNNEDEIDTE